MGTLSTTACLTLRQSPIRSSRSVPSTVNPDEVQTEALAYALTQLSIFEDRLHANELLKQCNYDGRQLGPILDAIEATAKAEAVWNIYRYRTF